MSINYFYPEYEVIRDKDKCIKCNLCISECANLVHYSINNNKDVIAADNSKCVNCHRCVSLCPVTALKVVKSDHTFKHNANWTRRNITEVYSQAETGGVLLSSMGNPKEMPVYWDKILINASQVTNPSIDPLREPMETKVFLGAKPDRITRDEKGCIVNNMPPHLTLEVPIIFSAMSYGSISLNAHSCLAKAAVDLDTYYNTGEGGLHNDFYQYSHNTII